MLGTRVNPGDVLGGKYKVERILGAGGMGIVVSARHVDLGQRVALKFMLKEAMVDPAHAERFLREAKSAVQLNSMHTARVLDVGRLKNGEPFMVMEYLDGRDLDAELHARGPLPPHVAVDYILQASEAIAEAHGLGIVHRDVKLKNLFLTKTVDGRPLVKVLDFGLAKTIGAPGDVSLTATNSVFGSPQYMSPEQMRSAKDVDFRSDIWSIGVCLYELLTGRVPFDAQGVAEICAMVLKDPVPRPSLFAPTLPADLEEVLLKCLEKDVTRRYQSVAELAFALQRYAADAGSADRILHVMQSAQKVEHLTVVNSPPFDAGAKTMNAWDSGLAARRPNPGFSRPTIAVLAIFAVMAVIGASAITIVMTRRPAMPPLGDPDVAAAASPAPPAPLDAPASAAQAAQAEPAAQAAQAAQAEQAAPAPAMEAAGESSPGATADRPAAPTKSSAPPSAPPARANGKPASAVRPKVPSTPPAPKATTTAKPPPSKNRPGSGAEYM